MRYVCSQDFGLSPGELIGPQHGPAGPVGPEDVVSVDGQPKKGPRSRPHDDLRLKKV